MIVLLIILLIMYLSFRGSVQYGAYQLTLASKHHDAQLALKYHNIDKIADNMVSAMMKEIDTEDEFASAIAMGMISGIKDTLPSVVKNNIVEEYESGEKTLDNISNLKILYLNYTNKPVTAKQLKINKIAKNKIEQRFCNEQGESCYVRVWEKEKDGWKVANIFVTE